MNYWVEKGADKKKLIMGMPMYGQTFTLNSPIPSGLGAPGTNVIKLFLFFFQACVAYDALSIQARVFATD